MLIDRSSPFRRAARVEPRTTPTTVNSGQCEPAEVMKSFLPSTWFRIQFSRSRPWQAEQSP